MDYNYILTPMKYRHRTIGEIWYTLQQNQSDDVNLEWLAKLHMATAQAQGEKFKLMYFCLQLSIEAQWN